MNAELDQQIVNSLRSVAQAHTNEPLDSAQLAASVPAFACHLPQKVMLGNRVKNFNHRHSVRIVQRREKGTPASPDSWTNSCSFPHLG